MAIPDFQTIMLPVLQYFSDKTEHTLTDTVAYIEKFFNLTDDERERLLPSGTQRVIYNRTAWTVSYMNSAKLVDIVSRR